MTTSITSLPDVCLFAIFDHLPITDLLNIDKVSSQWANLKQAACNRRTDLTLFVGDDPALKLVTKSRFPQYSSSTTKYSTVHCFGLNQNLADRLSVFISLTTLNIAICNVPSGALERVLALLDSSAPNLKHLFIRLKFMGKEQGEIVKSRFFRLFETINTLINLKVLVLEYQHFFGFQDIQLNVLQHLHQFYFQSIDQGSALLNSFESYAQANKSLTKIGLLNTINDQRWFDRILKLENASSFTHLNIQLNVEERTLDRFCSRFSSLTEVHLCIGTLSLCQLTTALAKLTQLNRLTLSLTFMDLRYRPLSEEDNTGHSIRSLTTIEHLQIVVNLSAHSQLESAHFGLIFPQIKQLSIEYYLHGCRDCGLEVRSGEPDEIINNCVRHLVKPWIAQCTRLERVVTIFGYTGQEREWPIER